MTASILRLDDGSLAHGIRELSRRDEHLASAVERHGAPPLWARQAGFETLVRLILEQQVSLDSGRAAYSRLAAAVGAVDAARVREAGEDRLRAAGLTRQKTRYLLGLAESIADGQLDLHRLELMSDDDARAALLAVIGIGPWTAECYLLFALCRPDAWPAGDLALIAAVQEVRGLDHRPSPSELTRISDIWRPWRGVAARILWHAYLAKRARIVPVP